MKIKYIFISVILLNSILALGCSSLKPISAKTTDQKNTGNEAALLQQAIQENNITVIKEFIADGKDLNIQDDENWTALMLASQEGRTKIVKQMIKAGADVNVKNKDGETALMLASQNGHKHAVKQLIKAGADVNAKDNDGFTPLMKASIEKMIKTGSVLIGNVYESVFRYPSAKDLANIAEQLIKAGADVNTRNDYGTTALMLATINGQTDTVKKLIKAGADVNAKNDDGLTALQLASEQNNTEIVNILTAAAKQK